jgi:ribonuclease HIII
MEQNTLSVQLDREEMKKVESILVDSGWTKYPSPSRYVVLYMKNGVGSVCSVYSSGKIVFQGKEGFEKVVRKIKENEVETINPHLGVDEVGKGDYFGPLVVTACFVNADFISKFSSLGIADSKRLSDGKILKIYSVIKKYPYYYSSIVYPQEYNRLVKEVGNVSVVLARQHSKVVEMALKDLNAKGIRCDYVVIDQFSNTKSRISKELGVLGRSIKVYQFHKGESDIAVACASVLARGIFLEEMKKMEEKYSLSFPKGASNVIDFARDFVKEYGEDELSKVAKVTFRTTKKVIFGG